MGGASARTKLMGWDCGIKLRRTKHVLIVRLEQRQEIVRSGQADDTGDVRRGLPGGGEIARIQRHQRGQVRARRMPHQV